MACRTDVSHDLSKIFAVWLRRQADPVEAGGGIVRGGAGDFEAVDGLWVGGDAAPMDEVAGGLDDALARIVAA